MGPCRFGRAIRLLSTAMLVAAASACTSPSPQVEVECGAAPTLALSGDLGVTNFFRIAQTVTVNDPGLATTVPLNDVEVTVYSDSTAAQVCNGVCGTGDDFDTDSTLTTDENGILDFTVQLTVQGLEEGGSQTGQILEVFGSGTSTCTLSYTIENPE